MDIVEILDRYAEGDEFQRPIETAIEEITKLREAIQAQAAVIESLTKRLASTNIIMEVVCAIHPDSACAKYELAENMNAIASVKENQNAVD